MSELTVVALATLLVAGCLARQDAPILATEGGGFIFNYRLGEAYAGIVVGPRPHRQLEIGSTIEVSFENPAGGDRILLSLPVKTHRQLRYTFSTPPLTGIEADRDYAVLVRLLGPDGAEVERTALTFRSDVDQSILPDKPLTVGPGYTRNPELLEPDGGG